MRPPPLLLALLLLAACGGRGCAGCAPDHPIPETGCFDGIEFACNDVDEDCDGFTGWETGRDEENAGAPGYRAIPDENNVYAPCLEDVDEDGVPGAPAGWWVNDVPGCGGCGDYLSYPDDGNPYEDADDEDPDVQ